MLSIDHKTLFVGLLVGLAHIACGIAALVQPASMGVTQLAPLIAVARVLGYSSGFVGAVLICAGVLALAGASQGFYASRRIRAFLFAPQELLLLIQIWSISVALISGHYPDGYVPLGGAWFILADQVWAWVLAVSHSAWLAAFMYGGAVRWKTSL